MSEAKKTRRKWDLSHLMPGVEKPQKPKISAEEKDRRLAQLVNGKATNATVDRAKAIASAQVPWDHYLGR